MLTKKPVAFCHSDPNQPRKEFSEPELRSPAASLEPQEHPHTEDDRSSYEIDLPDPPVETVPEQPPELGEAGDGSREKPAPPAFPYTEYFPYGYRY